uniref:Uncharacterized protein n=1 Tax=Zooxanthella nutricula TaxID=1333877 RepID=A0A6V0E4Q3_9DINO|mmetsp:Transcript_54530/g.165755  ORF Transcript_54530/g.165755 Transcript_54530/m.165755 type:complete len:229 (+) Transcript_54530:66-752(+)
MASHQRSLGECLLCVPLRYGVGLIALANCVYALLCVCQIFLDDVRLQSGGYNPNTRHIQTVVGVAGVLFAPLGLLGAFDNKVTWLRMFYYYQVAKLVVLGLAFASDLVALRVCESWVRSLEASVHPNPALYAASRQGLCEMARFYYVVGFLVDFGVNWYFAYATRDLFARLDANPAFMIRFGSEGDHLAPGSANHTQVTYYDEAMGEPVKLLGPTTYRTSELFGRDRF